MRTVTVYAFQIADKDLNSNVIAPRKATREAIEQLRCTPIMDTAEEVEPSRLDGNGFVAKAGA
jgi:hypothetical protein